MIEAWSPDQVRAAEAALRDRLPDEELMQRAARGLAEVVLARLEERDGSRVVALVGPGDNGADALYAAAYLAEAGFQVVAVHGDWPVRPAGLGVTVSGPGEPWQAWLAEADLVIDGVLGLGGRPGLPAQAQQWVDALPDDAYVISVDLPSGQDPAGETASVDAVFADETVTFGVPKPVHLLPATEAAVGRLTVVDIGLDLAGRAPAVQRLTFDDVAQLWPVPTVEDDKYSRGVLGIVAGGEDYTGAPIMATTAAVCAGAGMVRFVGTKTPTRLLRALVPEAVFGVGRVQAWVIGPGMDLDATGSQAKRQLAAAKEAVGSDAPVLLDAGGLDLLDGPRTGPTLLTPHAGELARLLTRLRRQGSAGAGQERPEQGPREQGSAEQVSRQQVAGSPLRYAREAADRTGGTVLLKGSTTLVVPPTASGLPVRSQSDAPAWLATAGAGDVLAGLAGALLAAGLPPLDAGSLAALVHGVAAYRANPGGPVRALAVAHGIPAAVAHLLNRPA